MRGRHVRILTPPSPSFSEPSTLTTLLAALIRRSIGQSCTESLCNARRPTLPLATPPPHLAVLAAMHHEVAAAAAKARTQHVAAGLAVVDAVLVDMRLRYLGAGFRVKGSPMVDNPITLSWQDARAQATASLTALTPGYQKVESRNTCEACQNKKAVVGALFAPHCRARVHPTGLHLCAALQKHSDPPYRPSTPHPTPPHTPVHTSSMGSNPAVTEPGE